MIYNFLIITSSYPAISGESFEGACIEAFAEALARLGHHVTVLTQCMRADRYQDSPHLKVQRFQWSKRVKPLSTLSIKHDVGKICLYFSKGLSAAAEIARDQNIDLVICAWALPAGVFGLYLKRRFGIPYVVWSLGSDIWSYSSSALSRRLLRSIFTQARRVYADGLSLIEQIRDIAGIQASFLPTSRLLPCVEPRNLALSPDHMHFLFTGRYHHNKGPDILIEAIHLLPPDLQSKTHFHFFGVGDMKEQLQSLIERYHLNHCIDLNGPINSIHLSQYLEAVNYIIIPSRIESIPVILSDALQKQCPIIATNVGDMGRLLMQYEAGYVAQQAEPQSLTAVISKAVINHTIAKDRMQALYSLFDPDSNARNFLQHFDSSSIPIDDSADIDYHAKTSQPSSGARAEN